MRGPGRLSSIKSGSPAPASQGPLQQVAAALALMQASVHAADMACGWEKGKRRSWGEALGCTAPGYRPVSSLALLGWAPTPPQLPAGTPACLPPPAPPAAWCGPHGTAHTPPAAGK